MDEEKKVLVKQEQTGNALKELQSHQGWGEVVQILSDMYLEGVTDLIEKDSIEVRARLRSIEELASQIRLKIDFGKNAAEELKAAKFTLTQDTP